MPTATSARRKRTIPGGRRPWLLIAVVLAAAVPRLWLAIHQCIEYDGWWHVFIARESNWGTFWRDVRDNAHPPLYYLLLKFACLFGKSRLVYRAVSLIAGLLAVYLVGAISERITRSRILGLLCGVAFGFSSIATVMSCEVRSYMLAVAFMLAALPPLLDVVELRPGRWTWMLLATALTLAIASHYSAAFFLFATAGALTLIALCNRDYRAQLVPFVAKHAGRLFAAWGVPLLTLGLAWRYHIRMWSTPMEHLPAFYFHRGEETAVRFMARSILATFNLFSPFEARHAGAIAITVTVLLLIAVVLTAWFPRTREVRSAVPVVLLVLIAGQIAIAALAGRYPFGGQMRHQFVLFPFLVLSVFALAGRAMEHFPSRRATVLGAIVIAAAIAASAWSSWRSFTVAPDELGTREMAEFRRTILNPKNVYVDQFNTIVFFAHHHQWDWTFAGIDPQSDAVERYTVTKKGRSMEVVRAGWRWNLDPLDAGVYESLRRTAGFLPGDSISLFHVEREGKGRSLPDGSADAIRGLAAERGLNTDALLVDGMNVFGTFSVR